MTRRKAQPRVSSSRLKPIEVRWTGRPIPIAGDERRATRLYGPAGHAYIYLIYGMHECFNVVCGEIGHPEAVLVRALEPTRGLALMAQRRGLDVKQRGFERKLCSGPGKLTQAMGINRKLHYGIDLCGDLLYIESGVRLPRTMRWPLRRESMWTTLGNGRCCPGALSSKTVLTYRANNAVGGEFYV